MHCRKLKTVPVVHRHVLVSYINVPSIMVRLERYLKAPQSIISLSFIFFGGTLYSEDGYQGARPQLSCADAGAAGAEAQWAQIGGIEVFFISEQ